MDEKRVDDTKGPAAAGAAAATAGSSSRSTAPARGAAVDACLPTWAPGERLAGRYRLGRVLGVGGMGVVYEAEDEELSVAVALKALRFDVGQEEQALTRLKLEVLLARSITHQHVCRVYDLGRHGLNGDSAWFLTMELLHGETLRERVRRRGRLGVAEVLPLVEQMVSGLAAAHRAGVVHLDFKSGNVIVGRSGGRGSERAVVTDFGLSRMVAGWPAAFAAGRETPSTAGGEVAGTPEYMAPEQVRGAAAGPAADIYAVGVVLYELMTGQLPFSAPTPWESAMRRLTEAPPPPRSLVGEIDEQWEAVILRCLAREPGARFARVEEVAEALSGREPWTALGTSVVRFSLPGERDAFVGREADLAELDRRMEKSGARLVTLLGTGGMGRTRLAVRYAWQSLGKWPGGVWFCDLSEARSVEGIVSAVGGALGVLLGKGDPVGQLGDAIAGRGWCLVVLDNFEQVVEQAEETVGRWVEQAREARFIVTSRERLGVRGEEVQEVEPLGMRAAMDLLVERATRQRPGFAPTEAERKSVQEIVRLAEGMPLAIELGAARLRVMTAGELAARMGDPLRVLGGGGAGRHAGLRAAIEGSWELLEPQAKGAWAQCAVFEGGFTLAAAEGVLDLSAWPDAPETVDLMQVLVDKSLLRMWVPAGAGSEPSAARFGMYASLQEYAREKLREMDTEAERRAEERHGRWYAQYGTEETLRAFWRRQGGVNRRAELARELENLVAGCRRAVERGDCETAAGTYSAVSLVLELRGPFSTGVALGNTVLGLPLVVKHRVLVLRALGFLERKSGRLEEARAHFEVAFAIARDLGDRRMEGWGHADLGGIDGDQGRVNEARAHYEAALANVRDAGDRHDEGLAHEYLGCMDLDQGRIEEARTHLEAALAIHRELGSRRNEGDVLGNLGILHKLEGRTEEARVHYEAALAIHREVGNLDGEGVVLGGLGNLLLALGRMDEARTHYEAVLAIARELGHRRMQAIFLGNLGIVHEGQGRMDEARIHYEAALAIHREVGLRSAEGTVLANLGNLLLGQDRIDEARVHLESALTVLGEVGDRRVEGVALGNLGKLFRREGRMEEAREALERGERLLRDVGDPIELGKLLCMRAELELESGDTAAARLTLHEAEELAAGSGAGPESELGRCLANLRQVLAGGKEGPALSASGPPIQEAEGGCQTHA